MLELVTIGLKVWDKKLSNKYFDQWREMAQKLKELESRPYSSRDQSEIDHLEYEILLLSKKIKIEMESHETK